MSETPASFLAAVAEALKAQGGVDIELADIVAGHLLTATPVEDCVEEAIKAIRVLAAKRAVPSKETADG